MSLRRNYISPFERALCDSDNQFVYCACYLLYWLAHCDVAVSSEEEKAIKEFVNACDEAVPCSEIAKFAKHASTPHLHLACEVVQKGFHEGMAPAPFIQIAIIVAIADGVLKPYENHLLRFFADLAGLSKADLSEVFEDITGREFPLPADLSRARFWQSHSKAGSSGSQKEPKQAPKQSNARRVAALAILGLQDGATPTDIRSAYRRLAHVHHPDRFAKAGEHHAKEANEVFLRIKEAYDYLVANA